MPPRAAARVEKRILPAVQTPLPRWFRPLVAALAALFLLGLFSPEAQDPDFWWHLKTGQYLWQKHALPVPDPFAYTTALGGPAYPGELLTRHVFLTSEWLGQAGIYLVYQLGGFAAVVLARAVLLTILCLLVAMVAYRRCGGFYRAVAAALVTASVAVEFARDRPFVISFVLLAGVIAILEFRRWLWLLPVIMLVWANAHGGHVLGWAMLFAYSAEALLQRPRDLRLPLFAGIAFLVSGINPNGFQVARVLLYERQSFLTSTIQEWHAPALWPPPVFVWLLASAVIVLVWQWRQVRPADWIMLALFGIASLTAQRNTILIAIVAPILIATYFPGSRSLPRLAELAAAGLLVVALAAGIALGHFFQFRAALWKYPAGAADFLLAHRVTAPIFNSYEFGGYLMWRLWPQEKVFIDGRALNETVFLDYARILYNHDETGGPSAAQLLDHYGVQAIVMNGFEYASGELYKLAPSLAGPDEAQWKLVYGDEQAIIFMRQPPAGAAPLAPLQVFDYLEAECKIHIEREPQYPRCARSLAQAFTTIRDFTRARRWLGIYLAHPHGVDAEAEQTYRQLVLSGR
jgi:hypothetical protein